MSLTIMKKLCSYEKMILKERGEARHINVFISS